MYKIFQIGFNKCGTVSLNNLFTFCTPMLRNIHWDHGKLAKKIYENKKAGKNLLDGEYENYHFYSDMESCFINSKTKKPMWYFSYLEDFKTLDKQYPGSKFILNTRNLNNWIISRKNHSAKVRYLLENNEAILSENKESYLKSQCEFYNKTEQQMVDIWRNMWHMHHNSVLSYFKRRQNDLLVYNIEEDDLGKIKKFFPEITFNIGEFPKLNFTQQGA